MSTIGELVPIPWARSSVLPAAGTVVTLYPDRQQVWGHRIYRMPPSLSNGHGIYDARAGLKEENSTGQLIDVFA